MATIREIMGSELYQQINYPLVLLFNSLHYHLKVTTLELSPKPFNNNGHVMEYWECNGHCAQYNFELT